MIYCFPWYLSVFSAAVTAACCHTVYFPVYGHLIKRTDIIPLQCFARLIRAHSCLYTDLLIYGKHKKRTGFFPVPKTYIYFYGIGWTSASVTSSNININIYFFILPCLPFLVSHCELFRDDFMDLYEIIHVIFSGFVLFTTMFNE